MKIVSEGFMRASNFPSKFCKEDLQIKNFENRNDFLSKGIQNTLKVIESKGEVPLTFNNNMVFFGPAKKGKTVSALQYLVKLHGIINSPRNFMFYIKEFDLFEFYKAPHSFDPNNIKDEEDVKKKVFDTQFLIIDNICEVQKNFAGQEFLSFFKHLIVSRIDANKRTLLIYDTLLGRDMGEMFADYFGDSLVSLLEDNFEFVRFE